MNLHFTPSKMRVERRTDNGLAGSGITYLIDLNVISKSNSTIVTLTPKTQETYQDGLILPFSVPDFDIVDYLSNSNILYEFELDSIYPPQSVEANFDRIYERLSSNDLVYSLKNSDGEFKIVAKIYPHKHSGSKVILSVTVYNKKSINLTIDVVKKINNLKNQIQILINS